jgi:6-phosphofructokinase 2
MPRILTITMNPAIDLTTAVESVVPGRKLRCDPPRVDPGGGGVNVSRVVKELGGATTALVAVAGATGVMMRELLEAAGIETVLVEAAGMTRQSFAVHDRTSGGQYRFVLPGPAQDAEFTERSLTAIGDLLATGNFPYVVASGSLPPGVPDDFYGRLVEMARAHGARTILDTSGPALAGALGRGAFLIRTNRIEAQELAKTLHVDPDDPERFARSIVTSGSAEAAIMALGADGALLVSGDDAVRIRPPHVDVVSPVGAGDSFVGALSFALAEGWPVKRACAHGVAAAAAAMITEATELAHRNDVRRLFAAIEDPAPRLPGELQTQKKAGER